MRKLIAPYGLRINRDILDRCASFLSVSYGACCIKEALVKSLRLQGCRWGAWAGSGSFAPWPEHSCKFVYGGRAIYQWFTMGIQIALPPNPHPMDLFRGSLSFRVVRVFRGYI